MAHKLPLKTTSYISFNFIRCSHSERVLWSYWTARGGRALCKKLMRRHHLRFVQPDIGYDHGPLSFLFDLICICICVIVFICEKVSQNIDPSKNQFFVNNCQYWTGTSALQPFLTPPDPWGGLGGPRGVWGGSADPKNVIISRRPISTLECKALG